MRHCFRTLWISDIHLGTAASRAAELLDFLSHVTAERIYLTGDIVDLERLKVRPYFPNAHRAVLLRLIELADAGRKVIYIPGNHDAEFRDLAGRELCGVPVMPEACHVTETGKAMLVIHGDVLDRRIRRGTNLEQFGASAYRALLGLDAMFNQLRNRLGREHVSLISGIKQRLGAAQEYIRRFEHVAAAYATERNYDGVVCGHIHRPQLREIDGIVYANDGDWVEHRTALAETFTGELQIVRWQSNSMVVDAMIDDRLVAA